MEIFILKIFDLKLIEKYNFKNKTSYLAYIFLSYIYYKKFNKVLNFNEVLKDKNGKPYLKNNEFFFNISHSKNYICIGISNTSIGVDIEEDRKISKNAISKFLNIDEINNIEISPLEHWVIKEAYSKYIGLGLKLNFKNINISLIKNDLYVNKIPSSKFICYAISKSSLLKTNFIKQEKIITYIKKLN